MSERILTLHPEGKDGVNIEKVKYDQMKAVILDILSSAESVTFKELTTKTKLLLKAKFVGSITWYLVTVKLDLEARGIIERVPNRSPQTLRVI